MQILPQFDPWGQAGQQIGGGIGNYLMQATDRARFAQNLSAAQKFLQPRQGPNGEMIQPDPTQTLFGLLQASEGNPAFLNTVSEIYPQLLQHQRNKATTAPGANPYRPRGGNQQRLPDGEIPNVPNRGPRSQNTLNGVPQQGSPYNEQVQADQTGGAGPAGGGTYDQPVMERGGRPQSVDEGQQPGNQRGMTGPIQGMMRQDMPPQQPPEIRTYTPEMEADVYQSMIDANATPEAAHNVSNQIRAGINQENADKIQLYDLDRQIAATNRQINDEQRKLVDDRLAEMGWVGTKENPVDPLESNWNRMIASELFYDASQNPNLSSDAQRWNETYKKMTGIKNAETNILSGTGNPWPWESYETAMKGAQGATKAFLNQSKAYNPKTGEYDPVKVQRAIRLNQDNDWMPDEAREIAIPLSDSVNKIVRSAPSMNRVEVPKGWESFAAGRDQYHETDKKKLDQRYDQVAKSLAENMGKNDSLLVARRKLFNNGNWNKNDFLEVLNRMEARGYKLSPYQEQERGLLQEDLKLTPGEIFSGYTGRKALREPKRLK